MNHTPGISRASSSRPPDAVPKVIADQSEHQQRVDLLRRHKWLLAHIRSSRADFTREFESRRRLLASLKPPPVNDPLVVEIEKQWTRLSADYHKSRKVNHYPDRKWRHGR
ncbi:hypothetical protein ACCT06_10700 [Rhizobium ruizarguesonis]